MFDSMDITDRLNEVINLLEHAISTSDLDMVENARQELMYVVQDLDSDIPNIFDEDDY